MNVELSDEAATLLAGHCERTGQSRELAIEDIVRRGVAQLDLRDVRDDVRDVRTAMLDLVAGQDALAPYAIALLSILAHWSVRTGGAALSEVEYQKIALDTGRLIWDALLTGRGIPIPARPASEQTPIAAGE